MYVLIITRVFNCATPEAERVALRMYDKERRGKVASRIGNYVMADEMQREYIYSI